MVAACPGPWTIVPATQFHDFAATVVGWTERHGVAKIAPLLVQPFSESMSGNVLLPGPGARISATTFDEWLAAGAT